MQRALILHGSAGWTRRSPATSVSTSPTSTSARTASRERSTWSTAANSSSPYALSTRAGAPPSRRSRS
jgi:hypothetical protein